GEVAYMKDTDGDGRADLRETWFTGFAEENPQLRANHPTFALDNRIYIANGLRGGTVVAKKAEWAAGAQPVSIGGRDFRFDPLSGCYEAVSGVGQFGMTFDDFGNRFVCSNRNPCKHVVLDQRYLERSPGVAVAAVEHDVSPAGELSRVFPIARAWTTSTLHAGQFTAACGVTIYRGDLLPQGFRGNSFTCEPTGHLVHRDVLSPAGATFTSKPGHEGIEFLASRDEWFSPVNLADGPDGALYVVDMYRAVIEHPQFMPEELKTRPDLRYGDDRGRIYRIVPGGGWARPAHWGISQDDQPAEKLTTAELVELLDHANGWHRDTAARLLYERQDTAAGTLLKERFRKGFRARGRVHALRVLDGLSLLDEETVAAALGDATPCVREQALLLSERFESPGADLRRALAEMLTSDADDKLAFQAVLTIGTGDAADPMHAVERLSQAAVLRASDPWMRTAATLAVARQPGTLLARRMLSVSMLEASVSPQSAAALAELVRSTWEVAGAGGVDAATGELLSEFSIGWKRLARARESVAPSPLSRVLLAALRGLGEGLSRRRVTLAAASEGIAPEARDAVSALRDLAVRVVEDREADGKFRIEAVSALRHYPYGAAGPPLKGLVASDAEQSLRLAAIEALARFRDSDLAEYFLKQFAAATPTIGRALLDAMLNDAGRAKHLLAEIEAGRFDRRELDAARAGRLLKHRDPVIRQAAHKLLAAEVPEERRQVIDAYQAALFGEQRLYVKADAERGRAVFEKNCVTCHRVGELGVNVAPDIADSRTRQPEQLLVDILDPNRAIDSNYFSYTVVTTEGLTHTGIVATETATSVTLRQPEGKTVSVLRDEIDEMVNNRVSLMPVGLEKTIPPEQMAELISFLKNWRYLGGRVPIDGLAKPPNTP
ncbi:MAG: c-type cytochrome, partial [Planctomycetes bacterium]|nr:c-type cytochrome [Planctomycetota bacterium]